MTLQSCIKYVWTCLVDCIYSVFCIILISVVHVLYSSLCNSLCSMFIWLRLVILDPLLGLQHAHLNLSPESLSPVYHY